MFLSMYSGIVFSSVHFGSLMKRQVEITVRNQVFVVFRVMGAAVISVILGSVWYNLGRDDYYQKFALFLFGALQVAFTNFSELPYAVENKYIAYKHVAMGMYTPMAYAISCAVVQVPIAAVESLEFSVVMYFMSSLVMSAGRFFFFWLVLFLVDICMASLFRLFAFIVPDMETAQSAPSPVISVQVIFAGFLIVPSKMGWLLFM